MQTFPRKGDLPVPRARGWPLIRSILKIFPQNPGLMAMPCFLFWKNGFPESSQALRHRPVPRGMNFTLSAYLILSIYSHL